jgi:hypothetical protein
MWKFKYFRADRKFIEMGPYATKKGADAERDKMASYGATCTNSFEVPGEVPKKDGSYVDNKVSIFKSYFQKEISILEAEGITYYISSEFLEMLVQRRLKLFIGENTPFVPVGDDAEGFPEEKIEEFKQDRDEYLSRVADIIENEASQYSPADGSFWESLSGSLKRLAKAVKTGEVKKKR